MRIAFSKKNDPRGKHVTLALADAQKAEEVHRVICEEILQDAAYPVRETAPDGRVIYRFNIRYAEALMYAFPMAEISEGVRRQLKRAEEKRIEGMEIPDIDVPGFTGTLYDFQKIGVDKIIKCEIDMLNDHMGLGKSFQALAALAYLEAFPALVVCPNTVKWVWAGYIEEYFPNITYQVVDGTKAERDEQIRKGADITIINVEGLRAKAIHENESKYSPIVDWEYSNPALFDREWEFLITDESQRVKNPTAQATRGFLQLKAWRELPMSGTPILNRPEEFWTTLHRLYPEKFDNYYRFVNEIAITVGPYKKVVAYRPGPMAELKEFIDSISLRRRKDQVLDDLPEVVRSVHQIDLSVEQRKIYDEIRDELILRLEDGTIKNIAGALPQLTRLKQACFSPELYEGSPKSAKVNDIKEIVEELVSSGEKAIVFSQWSKATRILQRELSEYNPAYVTGEIKGKDRQEQIDKFNNDEDCHIYIGTIGANREGINLGVASYVIFSDLGWTPAEHEQAIARSAAGGLRGAGFSGSVNVIEVQARDTIEERIADLLIAKQNVFDRVVDRDGGAEVKRVTLNDIRSIL